MSIKSKIASLFGFLVISALVITVCMLMSFNADKQQRITCQNVIVQVDNQTGTFFLEDADVKNILFQYFNDSLTNQPVQNLQLSSIEYVLKENPFVKNAESYIDMDGNLHINIAQKQPIARVINKFGVHYYMDENANKFPVNNKFTSRVPVITGNVEEGLNNSDTIQSSNLKNAFQLIQFIRNSELWSAQTEQINVNDNNEFEIIPKLGDQTIVIGDVNNLEEKFGKLELFYKQGLNYVGWDKYKTINVKFNNQIVCTKKDTLSL